MSMYLEYDAIVPTSRNPGANHAKLRDFRVVLFGLYFSSSIRVYPLFFSEGLHRSGTWLVPSSPARWLMLMVEQGLGKALEVELSGWAVSLQIIRTLNMFFNRQSAFKSNLELRFLPCAQNGMSKNLTIVYIYTIWKQQILLINKDIRIK